MLGTMAYDQQALDIVNTWTDQLNDALHPLNIRLSGDDATSIFPELARGSPLELLRSVTDSKLAEIAKLPNNIAKRIKSARAI